MSNWANNEEIQFFQEYLRIPSVHPDINYDACVQFLERQAQNLGLPIRIFHPADVKKPIVLISWPGMIPELPSILLNSHMDVVPVFEEHWTHKPFSADIDENGKIFARGTQDMKSVGMQYLAAIRSMKKTGVQLKRTVHVLFVPDEEIGGIPGMSSFVNTDDFRSLKIGFALDEGYASPTEVYPFFYAERSIWRLQFKCKGQAGHGSLLLENTAAEKVQYLINKFLGLRAEEVEKLKVNPNLAIGDVTTINLTMINGGVQGNVVPPEMTIVFDVRLAIDVDHESFERQINRWVSDVGNTEIEYVHKEPKVNPTAINETNPYWMAFKSTLVDDLNLKIKSGVFPGGTDSRFIRGAGIPAIGFTPINYTPVLLHDHDEFVRADTYLEGIEIYKKLITKIANV